MLSVKKHRRKESYDVTIQIINLSSSEILLSLFSYKIFFFPFMYNSDFLNFFNFFISR